MNEQIGLLVLFWIYLAIIYLTTPDTKIPLSVCPEESHSG